MFGNFFLLVRFSLVRLLQCRRVGYAWSPRPIPTGRISILQRQTRASEPFEPRTYRHWAQWKETIHHSRKEQRQKDRRTGRLMKLTAKGRFLEFSLKAEKPKERHCAKPSPWRCRSVIRRKSSLQTRVSASSEGKKSCRELLGHFSPGSEWPWR